MRSVMPGLYFFDFSFPSPKLTTPIEIDGKLSDWSVLNVVPDLMHLQGRSPFAHVYFGWDDDNLYIGLDVTGKRNPVQVDTRRFWRRDSIEVWIDVRNDKTQRRYTEHCHHFFFIPKGRRGNPELATACDWKEVGSAIPDTIFDHPDIEIASAIERKGYSLEARISRNVIPTYDPVNHPVIGFNYHINDTDRRAQWWSCGQDFPRERDPGTWGSIELVEGG
ncbi:sugar-binding protein [Candidatus Poribacteria bacterium]